MDFFVLSLATFRISSLISDEDGPFGLFERIRTWLGVKRDQEGQPYGTNNFATGLVCQWCNSVWIGAILTAAYYVLSKQVTVLICLPLAFSTVTIVLAKVVE